MENDQSHGVYIQMLEVLPYTTLQFYLVDYTYRSSVGPQNLSVLHGSQNLTEASIV